VLVRRLQHTIAVEIGVVVVRFLVQLLVLGHGDHDLRRDRGAEVDRLRREREQRRLRRLGCNAERDDCGKDALDRAFHDATSVSSTVSDTFPAG
jgi:hypothetical protein